MTLTVDDDGGTGRAITNDVTNLTINTPRGVQDITGLDKAAFERLLLLSDCSIDITGVWNPAANPSSFGVYSTHADNDSRTVVIVVGGKTFTVETILTDVSWDRAADGSFTFTANHQLSNGTAAAWS
jgi:hypothetical protein